MWKANVVICYLVFGMGIGLVFCFNFSVGVPIALLAWLQLEQELSKDGEE